jgi:hypothetical protein
MTHKERLKPFKEKKTYFPIFPDFTKHFGFDNMIFLSFLMYKSNLHGKDDRDVDKWFPMSNQKIQDLTGLSMSAIRRALLYFVNLGIIEYKRISREGHIKINWDALTYCYNNCECLETLDTYPNNTCSNKHVKCQHNTCSCAHVYTCSYKHVKSIIRVHISAYNVFRVTRIMLKKTSFPTKRALKPLTCVCAGAPKEEESTEEGKREEEGKSDASHPHVFSQEQTPEVLGKQTPSVPEELPIVAKVPKTTWRECFQTQKKKEPRDVFNAWNEITVLPENKCTRLVDSYKKLIQKKIKETPLLDWIKFFEQLEKAQGGWHAEQVWFNLVWGMQNMEKIINGGCRNKGDNSKVPKNVIVDPESSKELDDKRESMTYEAKSERIKK